jgi:hypothetical protein
MVIEAGDLLRRCAAAAKLPLATTVVKIVMLVMRSMDEPSESLGHHGRLTLQRPI